jgi:putative ABC transport system permease protein
LIESTFGANAGIPRATIVGVVGDIRHRSLEASAAPEVYIAASQNPPVAPVMVLRTTGDLAALAVSVRDTLRDIDPTLVTASIRTMNDVRLETVAERRFFTSLMGAFGGLALLLAVIGVYGMVMLTVSERRQEIGIRLALGARPARVVRRLLVDALGLVILGAAAGVGLSLAVMPLLASQLFGVGPADPLTLVAVLVLMLAVAGCAALLPSLSATRADPVSTLRAG